ncbi:heavy-metal-associated domain-containing protein [Campylobacter sp. faydin G-105]|uniref:heavy-metal-associated domain-containing protein n=1 Tax=Campylobacter anatolicus TaxID=2829105 RepID=UPI001B9DE4B6|nr:heavy-metal-associated domain-containing protein [Campylobacter anatolicus]MBR8462496.1 heavy-metal-associated domain-containing protein [Campylobacter anatolicus]
MKTYKVANIHCENCAKTIKNALESDFGEIFVDLSAEPRLVSVDLKDGDEQKFKDELSDLGFEVLQEI